MELGLRIRKKKLRELVTNSQPVSWILSITEFIVIYFQRLWKRFLGSDIARFLQRVSGLFWGHQWVVITFTLGMTMTLQYTVLPENPTYFYFGAYVVSTIICAIRSWWLGLLCSMIWYWLPATLFQHYFFHNRQQFSLAQVFRFILQVFLPLLVSLIANRVRGKTERLERLVRQQAAQLVEERTFQGFAVMASGVAHNFNQRFTVTGGNASLMIEDSNLTSRQRRYLKEIMEASEGGGQETRSLLEYAGEIRLDLRQIDLSEIAAKAVGPIEEANRGKIYFKLKLADQPVMIFGDSAVILQLITIILRNAAEAVEMKCEESGTVSISTGRVDIKKPLKIGYDPGKSAIVQAEISPGSYSCIRVEDTGPGIDIQNLGKIFDPFFTTKFRGRGLGLPIALRIVRLHHGAIAVRSTKGKGATFEVFFPVVSPKSLGGAGK